MNISLDNIKKWAFDSMEGADEPEFILYDDILFSIAKYEWGRRNHDFYVMSGMDVYYRDKLKEHQTEEKECLPF